MNLSLETLSNVFSISVPATHAEIAEAERFLNCSLPADYKDFLLMTNGLEGAGVNGYLVLWSSHELIELNIAYEVKEFVADVIIFGSDGAEDAYGFDLSVVPAAVIKLPFVGMGYVPSEKLADSFEDFLSIKLSASFFK